MSKNLIYILLAVLLCSCGEYQHALKSRDFDEKYDYAMRAYEEGRYVQASTLLKECITVFKGSDKAETALFILGMSEYKNKDYFSSGSYFRNYYQRYPKGKYAEEARFNAGYGYYLDSPEPQLDQTDTYKAIEELQSFINYFPRSQYVPKANNAILELQEKLTLKQLQNAQLYYNMGTYLGNNYESAIIVAKNALKEYPYSKYAEDLQLLVLKSKFQEASLSVDEKKAERFRDVIDEYYTFTNNYPNSKNTDEVENILKIAKKYVKD